MVNAQNQDLFTEYNGKAGIQCEIWHILLLCYKDVLADPNVDIGLWNLWLATLLFEFGLYLPKENVLTLN